MSQDGNEKKHQLARLRHTWGTRYEIGEVMGIWRAQRLADASKILTAASPMELREMLLRDFPLVAMSPHIDLQDQVLRKLAYLREHPDTDIIAPCRKEPMWEATLDDGNVVIQAPQLSLCSTSWKSSASYRDGSVCQRQRRSPSLMPATDLPSPRPPHIRRSRVSL